MCDITFYDYNMCIQLRKFAFISAFLLFSLYYTIFVAVFQFLFTNQTLPEGSTIPKVLLMH